MIICKAHGENRMMEDKFFRFLEEARIAMHPSTISHAIQSFVEAKVFSIVRGYVGHS